MDAHNHALAALRYLVSKLDERHMARHRGARPAGGPLAAGEPAPPQRESWVRVDNEALWTRLG